MLRRHNPPFAKRSGKIMDLGPRRCTSERFAATLMSWTFNGDVVLNLNSRYAHVHGETNSQTFAACPTVRDTRPVYA